MRLRHITSLALFGWYLMIPPINPSGVDTSAALSKWIVYKDYDSVAGCVSAQSELRQRAQQDPNVTPPLQFTVKQREQFASADCIASDDPRLKPN